MLYYNQEIRDNNNVLKNLLLAEISKEDAECLVNEIISASDLKLKSMDAIMCSKLVFLEKRGWDFNPITAKDNRHFQSDFYIMFYRYTTYWFNESVWYEDSILLANKTMFLLSNALMYKVVNGIDYDKLLLVDCLKSIMYETLRDDYLRLKDSSGRITIPNGYVKDIYHLLEIFKLTDKVVVYNYSFCKKKTSYAKNIYDITDELNRYITKLGDKDNVTSDSVCRILNISKTTLSTWIKNGIITTYKKEGKAHFYKLSDVLKDLKRR